MLPDIQDTCKKTPPSTEYKATAKQTPDQNVSKTILQFPKYPSPIIFLHEICSPPLTFYHSGTINPFIFLIKDK
ncbi:hypothetical protein L1987_50832 [Smallanthus sonchifolius]|uniref:Uncharacterized protein n=1 Tax=Smallanthus sonchifolius TaxID=185202 RepID=A0ACB9EPS0_9ASTR|nr:hypothetical protein L1987_50832 [Smallanthus sonchifolius]